MPSPAHSSGPPSLITCAPCSRVGESTWLRSRIRSSRRIRRRRRAPSTSSITLEALQLDDEKLAQGAAAKRNRHVADAADLGEITRQFGQFAPGTDEDKALAHMALYVGGQIELIVDSMSGIPFKDIGRAGIDVITERRQH